MELIYVPIKPRKKEGGRYVCPHNPECRCVVMTCNTCGWYPPTAQKRKEKQRGKKMITWHGRRPGTRPFSQQVRTLACSGCGMRCSLHCGIRRL